MAKFNPDDLPELTKSMYFAQQNWSAQNWKDTLLKHSKEVEELFKKIN